MADKKLAWIAQCGFTESIHLELVEKYLRKVSVRLGADLIDIVKKAGVGGVRIMLPQITDKLFEQFRNLDMRFTVG